MKKTTRRDALKHLAAGSLALGAAPLLSATTLTSNNRGMQFKGIINHSVCRWTFGHLTVEQLCQTIKEIGFSAIDLAGPKDWPVLQQNGVYSSMCNGAEISLTEGWNNKQYHATLIKNYTNHIELVAKAGYKNLICFSGNRRGMDDETGLRNCAEGLKKIAGLAEKKGVVIQMELLNSKVDHKDYMCDKTAWGAELCKRVGSPNFKLLYDIYHMQIDEGDVIRTILDNTAHIGHYHTGGVPGRHIIDETQELYYPAIMKAIASTGFTGYVAQEFIPESNDKAAELRKAIGICDI
ncbi:MAG: TIM barrel protein [Chitinophagaceae bacterium]